MPVGGLALACLILTLTGGARPVSAQSASGTGVHRFAGADQVLAFEGRGAGHGVGLCQWGARGRALAGQSAGEIMGAYFAGTGLQPVSPPDPPVRVRIHEALDPAPGEAARIVGWDAAWQAMVGETVEPVVAPAGALLEVGREEGVLRYTVRTEDGSVLASGPLDAPLALRPIESGGAVRFSVGYKPARAAPGPSGARYDVFRGELILTPRDNGVETVNLVGLEDYVRGVVPAEMPVTWPAEALRAQALATRSYAVWRVGTRAAERYDLTDTSADQAYLGANAEHPLTDDAVGSTTGLVVTHGERVAQTVFSSTCGGWTENNETVWPSGTPLPYLRGIRDVDPAGRAYDADAPQFAWKTGSLTAGQLEAILAAPPGTAGAAGAPGAGSGAPPRLEVGKLVGIDLSDRTASGRLLSVKVVGTQGTRTLRPDEFLARFNAARPPGVGPLHSTTFGLAAETGAARPQTAAPAGPRVHTVQRGETLSGIARTSGTTVAALVATNRLGSPDAILQVGQRLTIP